MSPETTLKLQAQAKHLLWQRGRLRFKGHSTQQRIYDSIRGSEQREFFLLCSRRLGKSFLLVLLAFEQCLNQPNSRVLYLAPWAKDAQDIAVDAAAKILEDCPPHLLPRFNSQSKEYQFPNGSLVRFKGVNGEHAQYLRGGEAHVVLIDEAGLMDDFEHVLLDVVAPMTLTTKGRIYIATTPARSPSHESYGVYERMAKNDAVFKFTLLDAPHIAYEDKVRELIRCGEAADRIPDILSGKAQPQTITARREFWCEWLTDASLAVIPEFTPELEKTVVRSAVRPDYFDSYVSMDPGIRDSTGLLFAFWDFTHNQLVVEDEALVNRTAASTPNIAKLVKDREGTLWPNHPPYLRVSDIDARLIQDLWTEHKLQFVPADKGDSLGAINLMRSMVQNQQIIIHPRCRHLVRQLRNAVWNTKASDLERTVIDGHFDLVMALKYMCRHVVRGKNPTPVGVFNPLAPGEFRSRKRAQRHRTLGLMDDTPAGRRLSKVNN